MVFILLVIMVFMVGVPSLIGTLPSTAETHMGMVVVLSVSVVLVLLYLMAAGFASLGLASRQNAIGLPEGSMRALIALFLIMIFIMVSVHMFRAVAGQTGATLKIWLLRR